MCLAIPMKILEINSDEGILEVGGVRRSTNISLLQDVQIGDYVIVHAGFAISKLEPLEAEKTLALFKDIENNQSALAELSELPDNPDLSKFANFSEIPE